MKGPGQLLARLGEVLLGERDPVGDGGGVAPPGLVDGVGLDAALLGAQTCHFYSLRHFIDLEGERREVKGQTDVTFSTLGRGRACSLQFGSNPLIIGAH